MSDGKSPFIPAWLDDANLTANQFRVVCHLWRNKPGFRPSGPAIARRCRMAENTVWRTLSELEKMGFLERKKAGRNQNIYTMLVVPVTAIGEVASHRNPDGGTHRKVDGGCPPNPDGGTHRKVDGDYRVPTEDTQFREPTSGEAAEAFELAIDVIEFPKEAKLAFPEEVIFWNTFEALPKVKLFPAKRKKALEARRKDPEWRANWKTAIEKLAASSFATGTNDRGWKAGFDFILQPQSLANAIEGNYDDRPAGQQAGGKTINFGRRGQTDGYNERTDF